MGGRQLQGEGVEQAEKQSPAKEGDLNRKEKDLEEDSEPEDEFQEGMDEVEKCLDITLGDVKKAMDRAEGKTSNKKAMKMSQVAKRCVSI